MASPRRTPGRNGRPASSTVRAKPSRAGRRPSKADSKVASAAVVAKSPVVSYQIQQQLLETITASVTNGRVPEEVAEACLRVLIELTEVPWAAVYLLDEQTKAMRCVAVCGDAGDRSSDERDSLTACVVRNKEPAADGRLLAYPLKRGRRLEGVLLVLGLPHEKRGGDVGGLLDFVAARLAVGLDHSRLAQKYAQKIVRIKQLEEVTAILNSSLEEIEVLQRALEVAVKLVDAEAALLLLLDEPSGDLVCQVAAGEKGAAWKGSRLAAGKGVAGLVARNGKPLIVNDAQHDPRVAEARRKGDGIRTLLTVPVRARGKMLGVLEAVNKHGGRSFSNWDLIELSSLGTQLAIALENFRLFRSHGQKIQRLNKLQEVSRVLNSTLNQAEIRERAIESATVLMEAEAGSLLLLDEAAGELYFEVALGAKGKGVREIRLKVGEGIAGYVAQTGEPMIVNDTQGDPRFSRRADDRSKFVTRNMVCVPVKARDKLLGVLQAINKKDGGRFGANDLQDFVSLGHQVGIAIENANLYEEINRLFEGFISASVLAIESRDPTTSGHSGRVATLTCGLAEIVDGVESGPYAETTFDHEQMKELRYAAVLHDFGKVGVREHVLVKAQKLLPDELATLKSRFDFIKRTLEVRALRRKVDILASGDRAATAAVLAEVDEDLARQVAETDGILDFLLRCNQPTVLPTGGFDRLHEIAQLQYDHFNEPRPYLTGHETLALSIPKGSLTAEERLEIESHVTHTYRFLSTIPWTKSLQNIPSIAYGHHEKLDGSGYPRRVPGDTIPVQTRMMTICDIFDALTSSDRPYKSSVPAPRALAILDEEVKRRKVDAHLLEIFIEGKVYRRVMPA
ncbi:MAG: GAF domain-containing protein [Nitrospirae bacterium]|nr:GAF domain-containing protein [Nitrospirota bacterium]